MAWDVVYLWDQNHLEWEMGSMHGGRIHFWGNAGDEDVGICSKVAEPVECRM
jgi:hypothetical protein